MIFADAKNKSRDEGNSRQVQRCRKDFFFASPRPALRTAGAPRRSAGARAARPGGVRAAACGAGIPSRATSRARGPRPSCFAAPSPPPRPRAAPSRPPPRPRAPGAARGRRLLLLQPLDAPARPSPARSLSQPRRSLPPAASTGAHRR
eukprot:6210973-Pleurochrysis_carterae.AAC.5